jgi:glycosyltransferase involved in cell wall biosynthesis
LFTGPRRSRAAGLGERLARIPTRVDFPRSAHYVFVSDFVRDRSGIPRERTDVAHSGIHPDFLDPAEPRDWLWRLLYVGRLDERKGIETAIEALRDLPQAELRVVGDGDERERRRLQEIAAPFGDRVEFAGQVDRPGLLAAYAAADAVVFPVRWEEPWGLVPLEAMARGRPVVGTGRGGSSEYLRDEDNCLLFPAGDAGALAAAVRRLADDPALRERLRDAGVRTASSHLATGFDDAVERHLLAAAVP